MRSKKEYILTGEEEQELKNIIKKHSIEMKMSLVNTWVILISSAGAEGISLKCVRQVHIRSFWNYIRIDQVLGRAIEKSHMNELYQKVNVM